MDLIQVNFFVNKICCGWYDVACRLSLKMHPFSHVFEKFCYIGGLSARADKTRIISTKSKDVVVEKHEARRANFKLSAY